MCSATVNEIQIRLETKIAYQEKAIAELNEVLVDQTKTMIDLQKRIELLEKVVRNLSQQLDAFSERPPHEKPPHY